MRDKIVFLRLGALGDILVGLSALEKVVRAHPGKEIVICGNALWLEVLRAYPQLNIRTVFVLKEKYQLEKFSWADGWHNTGVTTTFYKLACSTATLYNLRFESLRYSWHAFFARVPVRYGSSPRFFRFLFTHWYGWLGEEPPIHERDWLNAIVAAPPTSAGTYSTWRRNRKPLQEKANAITYERLNRDPLPEMTLAENTPEVLAQYKLAAKKYILINPTASRRDKAWPAENFRALAEFLAQNVSDYEIRIIGSPSETDWLNEAAGENTILQPKGLSELFHIVKGAAALVTNTSSMQFIASATRVPTLTLMGWADPIRWGPLGGENLVVRGTPGFHSDIFKRDEESYRSIPVDRVTEASLSWLRAKRLPR